MLQTLKTSEEWYAEIPKELGFIIYDPDGWDRKHYQFSFYKERITKQEFLKRVFSSTCLSGASTKDFFDNWSK